MLNQGGLRDPFKLHVVDVLNQGGSQGFLFKLHVVGVLNQGGLRDPFKLHVVGVLNQGGLRDTFFLGYYYT